MYIPQISYSLLASYRYQKDLATSIGMLADIGVDMIHYDVSEEQSTLALEWLPAFFELTPLPFDVHLSVGNPLDYLASVKLRPEDYLSLHVEHGLTPEQYREFKLACGCKFGVAINTDTPLEALQPAIPFADYILFMAAPPGISGCSFNEGVLDKMMRFKAQYPDIRLHADGGIDSLSSAALRDIGVDVLVSGSYILKDNDAAKQVAKLFGQNLNLPVSSMMRVGAEIPLVAEDCPISRVAMEIDDKRIGCACVVDANHRLVGLITDTDLRRSLIKEANLSNLKARDLMNAMPYTVDPKISLIKLLRDLEKMTLFFTVVPVVSDERCVGVLRMQDILFSNALGLRVRHQ